MVIFGTVSGGAGAAMTGGNFWQGAVTGLVVSGLNHAMHDGDEDPPKKFNLKRIEATNSDGLTQKQYDNLSTFEKMFSTPPGINASSGCIELIGGPAKGVKYLAKMVSKYPGAIVKAEQIGSKYWKYTAEVSGSNGMTIHTKILNMNGKTMKYFHDKYNSANKFMHRGWTEGSIKVHQWWNGVKQYGQHFFQNR
ncbi:hypothetical protein [Flavobacterium sp.]|uniref:hypothetical protein n=1 Tax=Flavobacterium sp. TaxID=239 RepID=UPI0037522674